MSRLCCLSAALLVADVACVQGAVQVSFDGDGSGAVVSSFGKRCSAACEVPPSTLTAEADEFSAFDGWSGNGCSGIGECPVSYGSVTASFRAVAYPIVVRVTGKGSVERDGQPVPVGQPFASLVTRA